MPSFIFNKDIIRKNFKVNQDTPTAAVPKSDEALLATSTVIEGGPDVVTSFEKAVEEVP